VGDVVRERLTPHAVLDALDPTRRARLLAINPHLRPGAALSVTRGRVVDATAQWSGSRVDLVAKGLRLDLTPNARLHPQVVARRRRREHQVVTAALRGITPPAGPWRVCITRVGPRAMDDDNRTASAKGCRDAVAAWLGVDDGSDAVRWEVRGEVARGYAVRISVEGCE
jgi:hypothetical protein